jgi:hypothetical protein
MSLGGDSMKNLIASLVIALGFASAPVWACFAPPCVWQAPKGEDVLNGSPVLGAGTWQATLLSASPDSGGVDRLFYVISGGKKTLLFESGRSSGPVAITSSGDVSFFLKFDGIKYSDDSQHAHWTSLGLNTYRLYWEDGKLGKCPDYTDMVVQIAQVPEPGEWAMMLAGLSLLGVVRRRRNS